jgi:hypothetical protein
MDILGRFGGVVVGVLAALVVVAIVIGRWIRSRRPPVEPEPEPIPTEADYLDSSHIIGRPPLRRDGTPQRNGGERPASGAGVAKPRGGKTP